MKKTGHLFLIFFLIILVVASLAVFLFSKSAFSVLDQNLGIKVDNLPDVPLASSQGSLDTSVMSDPRFTALQSSVSFSAAAVCQTPVGKREIQTVVNGATTTKSEILRCVQGNGVPLLTPVKSHQ